MTWYRSKRPGRWRMAVTPRGTARVTFADGSYVTVFRNSSPAEALRRAHRLHQRLYVTGK